jgi:hypothetical protein
LCCACSGGYYETLGQAGDTCLGYDETTGIPFPDCAVGLECVAVDYATIPGWENVCQEVYVAPVYYDGTYYSRENEAVAYWYYGSEDSTSDGRWIGVNGTETGYWDYDQDTTETGTWSFDDGSNSGTWAVDTDDSTIKYDTTACENTAGDVVDIQGYDCEFYSYGNQDLCGVYDTVDFRASIFCCACEGGTYYVADEDTVFDEEGNIVIDETTFDSDVVIFTLNDIDDFPLEVDYDCDEDNIKIIYTTTDGEFYIKTYVEDVECTAANDCFYEASTTVSGI